jgi:aryl-alcohol dehydrogenase-like predicted oxidoreductase
VGLDVSELALGTWGLSGDGYGPVSRSEAEATVRRAVEMGITLFDTSDSYGKGSMEELLGRVLEPHAAATMVATRHGVDRSQVPARKRFDPAYLERAFEASRARLRREVIDVYLLHNPTVEPLVNEELRAFLQGLKQSKKIRAWGVSAGSVEVARAALDAGAEVIELAYNALFCADLHALGGELAASRVGVLAHSVLGYGLLAGMWPKTKVFQPGDHRRERWQGAELVGRLGQLDAVRSLQGGDIYTLRAASLRFVLANHLVSSVVLGPRSVTQLEQLVREAGKGPPYLDEEKLSLFPSKLLAVGIDP